MQGKLALQWMNEQDRTTSYLARESGINPDRLVDLIAGSAGPTDDEAAAISDATGISTNELQQHTDAMADPSRAHPYQCYTVAQVAAFFGISTDLARAEMKSGKLQFITIGERAQRIPLWAIKERVHEIGGPPKRPERAPDEPSGSSPDPVDDTRPPRRLL